MQGDFFVALSVADAAKLVEDAVVRGSITGECIDSYPLKTPNGGSCTVLVFEKHYYRAGNRLTLTVVLDDFTQKTRVHCIGGGGGEGLFRFDWGASESFASVAFRALEQYRI